MSTPPERSANSESWRQTHSACLGVGERSQWTSRRNARTPQPTGIGVRGTTSTLDRTGAARAATIMLEQRDGLNSESQPTPFDPLGEAPARDPNTLPGYPKGWNPLVDGPLQGDEHAAQLWRDWQNAEGDRNEWAARWAWNRYVRYATGETGDPETPRVVDRRPFLNVLMSIRQRAIRDGDERLVTLVDASIDADAEAMTPQLIEGQLRLVRAHEELRRNWKRLRSSAEWWVRYYLDLGWQSECVQCVERDADGNVPAVDYIVPVGPRSVDAFVTSCLTCGRRP